jgi:hypothetical protein
MGINGHSDIHGTGLRLTSLLGLHFNQSLRELKNLTVTLPAVVFGFVFPSTFRPNFKKLPLFLLGSHWTDID